MKKLLIIATLSLVSSMAVAQSAQTDAERTVVLRLNHLHESPTLSELEAITPDARKIVERTALSGSGLGQKHAIAVLANLKDQRAQDVLTAVLADPKTSEITQHQLVLALVVNFGDRAIDVAATWLKSEDLQRRLTAIDALGKIDTDLATGLLEKHLTSAKSKGERDAVESAIRRIR